ncbi:dTDP-glucose 4,6-dehydratase [Enterococcus florum]|uniref:dTDP-glucose 4,6-dehydratase n=1 Tax=Enterococcus florum TaxID=2480627 RepID=A0A4P5PCA0_9ENTE|nr:NAD-dependent epimerase/dehydratase family protein [Enterococcus florum]GCF93911.1 dTDP-glucose 4,6-dehydratase [Enterococcus florum]
MNNLYIEDIERVADLEYDWERIDNHSILVVGASGMLGTCLIDVLMTRNKNENANIKIYAMGRNEENLKMRFEHYSNNDDLTLIRGDITDPIPNLLNVDYVIHAASNTHPKAYSTDPIGTIMTNILGMENVLKYAESINAKRSLFLSSVEIYGENNGDVEYFKESYCGYIDCNTLRAGYSESKRVSEALCQAYIESKKMDIVIPRLARVFGPTMRMSDSKASSQFIKNAANQESIVLKSEGNQLFSYIYVCDAVSSLIFLLINGQNGQAYNIGNPNYDLRLKDLAQKLAEIAGVEIIYDLPDEIEIKGYSKATKALLDVDKIRKLGWSPIFELETALSHTVEIIEKN